MNNISFSNKAWGEYIYWQNQDKKTLKRINILVQDISRNKFAGIGKPEPLKGELSGFWSRRIDEANRLVYKISNDQIKFINVKVIIMINSKLNKIMNIFFLFYLVLLFCKQNFN